MGDWTPIPLALGQNAASTGAVSLESLENLAAELHPPSPLQKKAQYHLRHTPGLKRRATVGLGPIRGLAVLDGLLYVVSGNDLYSVDSNYNAVLLTGADGLYASDLATVPGTGPVPIANNGRHIAICTSTNTLVANQSGFSIPSQFNFNGADYQDGYGIFTERDTQFLWLSNLDDLTVISGLDFTSADAESDNVVGCLVSNEELLIFKERTLEQWFNAGAASFPYVRSQNGVVERGCAASASIAQANRAAVWLGDDLRVYAMQGLQPQPISAPDIERLIENVDPRDIGSAEGFTYQQDGQLYYVLSFATLSVAYSFDTGKWHKRTSPGLSRYRASGYAYWLNRHIVGDSESGNLYELRMDELKDNDDPVIRRSVLPPVYGGGNPVFMGDLLLDTEAGTGLNDGQGEDPKIMLELSDDDGRTWSSQRPASMGKIGQYDTQAVWTRLGRFRRTRHLRLSISDPVPVHWVSAAASLEVGA
ncbi:MAG: hypothetical protein AAF654_10995 [Myxococcota bacterium]